LICHRQLKTGFSSKTSGGPAASFAPGDTILLFDSGVLESDESSRQLSRQPPGWIIPQNGFRHWDRRRTDLCGPLCDSACLDSRCDHADGAMGAAQPPPGAHRGIMVFFPLLSACSFGSLSGAKSAGALSVTKYRNRRGLLSR